MKKYSKPEIKVKVVVLQHLMDMSTREILESIVNPEVSQSKMEDMFWDLLEE